MGEAPTVTLYVRSLSPRRLRSRQAGIVQRLEVPEANSTVDDYSVEAGGKEVLTADAYQSAASHRIHERIEPFREWAATNGQSLDPFFTTETTRSTRTTETHTSVVLPVMTLVEYADDEVRCGSLSADGETVADGLGRPDTATDRELVTDGGEESVTVDSDGKQTRFQTLFVDITGTEEVVARQEVAVASHVIDDDTTSISAYVTDVAKEDGLVDTIDGVESSQID